MSESHGSWRPCESRWKTLRHPCRPRPGWWWGPLDVGPWTRTSRRPHGDEKIWGSDDQTDQTKDLRHALSIFVVCRVAMVVAVAVANCALASDSSPNTEHKKSDASSFMRQGNSNLMALPFRATQQSSGIQCRFTCHGMSATSGENWICHETMVIMHCSSFFSLFMIILNPSISSMSKNMSLLPPVHVRVDCSRVIMCSCFLSKSVDVLRSLSPSWHSKGQRSRSASDRGRFLEIAPVPRALWNFSPWKPRATRDPDIKKRFKNPSIL